MTVTVQPAGHDSALVAKVPASREGGPIAVDLAKQQAALSMLHQLQALVQGLLGPTPSAAADGNGFAPSEDNGREV